MSRFGLTVVLLICVRAASVAPEIRHTHLGVGSQRLRRLISQYSKQHLHRFARKGWRNGPGTVALSQAHQKSKRFSSKMMRKAHLANGLILLGMLGFSGVLFYLSKSRFQHSTRHLMLRSGSLLCTVLAFMAMKKIWKLSTPHHDLVGGLFSAMRFLALFVLVPWLGRRRGVPGKAMQVAAGHLVGFAGADTFAQLLRLAVTTPGQYLLGVLGVQLLWVSMALLCSRLKQRYESLPHSDRDELDAVSMQEMHREAGGFAVGFLISVWVRFAVVGSVPGSPTKTGALTQADLMWMSFGTCLALMLCILVSGLSKSLAGTSANLRCAVSWLAETTAMTASWLVFFWLQWLLWYSTTSGHRKLEVTERLAAFMLQALVASLGSVAVMGTCGAWSGKDATPDCLLRALALQMGYSWEVAMYGVLVETPTRELSLQQRYRQGAGIIAVLLCSVLPAWWWHLAPKAHEKAASPAKGSEPSREASMDLGAPADTASLPLAADSASLQPPPEKTETEQTLSETEKERKEPETVEGDLPLLQGKEPEAEDTDALSPASPKYDRGLSSASVGRPNRRFVEVSDSSSSASERESPPPTPPPQSPRQQPASSKPLGRRPVFYSKDDED
ncbi:ttll6 [Symbiodinium sp. CCMP2456]|nr:ttll6 [Symbiodinium sp. CCMP2456]